MDGVVLCFLHEFFATALFLRSGWEGLCCPWPRFECCSSKEVWSRGLQGVTAHRSRLHLHGYSHIIHTLQQPRDLCRDLQSIRFKLSRGRALGEVVNSGAPFQNRVFKEQVCWEENKETSGTTRSAKVYRWSKNKGGARGGHLSQCMCCRNLGHDSLAKKIRTPSAAIFKEVHA